MMRLTSLIFWCDIESKVYSGIIRDESSIYWVTTDQFLLGEMFLIDIKFGSDNVAFRGMNHILHKFDIL